jgi:hypothetical protein
MEQISIQNAQSYAALHDLRLAERLGFGIHGTILVAENNSKGGKTAIKALHSIEFYLRERNAYQRLQAAGIAEITGFNVPQLIHFNDELLIVEMTIVTRPFLLDFAGAYLDSPPEFSPEIWKDWESQKREQFEDRWPIVRRALDALEDSDIYMVDVSPTNISFLD